MTEYNKLNKSPVCCNFVRRLGSEMFHDDRDNAHFHFPQHIRPWQIVEKKPSYHLKSSFSCLHLYRNGWVYSISNPNFGNWTSLCSHHDITSHFSPFRKWIRNDEKHCSTSHIIVDMSRKFCMNGGTFSPGNRKVRDVTWQFNPLLKRLVAWCIGRESATWKWRGVRLLQKRCLSLYSSSSAFDE